jgi:ribonuclease BN (tRNA processing enzyme)
MVENSFVFYGVRGSYPVPHPSALKYGGNTSCLMIEAGDDLIILDCGTGIIDAGKYLMKEKPGRKQIDIYLTHYHSDHIQGLPFFGPVFNKDYRIDIYCDQSHETPLEQTILSLFNQPFSPIGNAGIKADINFIPLDAANPKPLKAGEHITLEYIKEPTHPTAGVLFYKITIGGKQLVYATDVESPDGFPPAQLEFIKGVDVLIHDTMYIDSDYNCPDIPKKGFGHSTVSMALNNAIKGEVKKLFLFHYNPNYSDDEIDRMYRGAKAKFKNTVMAEELKKFSLRS